MNHDRTYRPVPHVPAPRLRDADGSMRPHTYGVRVCSFAAIATEPCRPTACAGEYPCCTFTHPATAHYSLLTAHSSYTFSAKEKDPETGLSYFGSRYYSSDLSVWLSVDPMSGKYPSLSPYVCCADNPVRLVDPDRDTVIAYEKKKKKMIRSYLKEIFGKNNLFRFSGYTLTSVQEFINNKRQQ